MSLEIKYSTKHVIDIIADCYNIRLQARAAECFSSDKGKSETNRP